MSIFCRVVEMGSFTAIARELNTSQSTVSKHIAALEQRLETKLLIRSTRQLHLTEAGEQYYQRCLRILDDIRESEANINNSQSQPTGNLRITVPVMFGRLFIAPMLWQFQNTFPEITIELLMNDENIDLIRDGIDLAIRVGRLTDSSLIARKIGRFPQQVLVASPDYLDKWGEPKTLQALKQHNCLLHSLQATSNLWEFDGPHGDETVQVESRFIANNRDTVNDAAISGMGIAISYLEPNLQNIEQGRLKVILPQYYLSSADIFAIYPERHFVPQKVRSLIEWLESGFISSADEHGPLS